LEKAGVGRSPFLGKWPRQGRRAKERELRAQEIEGGRAKQRLNGITDGGKWGNGGCFWLASDKRAFSANRKQGLRKTSGRRSGNISSGTGNVLLAAGKSQGHEGGTDILALWPGERWEGWSATEPQRLSLREKPQVPEKLQSEHMGLGKRAILAPSGPQDKERPWE